MNSFIHTCEADDEVLCRRSSFVTCLTSILARSLPVNVCDNECLFLVDDFVEFPIGDGFIIMRPWNLNEVFDTDKICRQNPTSRNALYCCCSYQCYGSMYWQMLTFFQLLIFSSSCALNNVLRVIEGCVFCAWLPVISFLCCFTLLDELTKFVTFVARLFNLFVYDVHQMQSKKFKWSILLLLLTSLSWWLTESCLWKSTWKESYSEKDLRFERSPWTLCAKTIEISHIFEYFYFISEYKDKRLSCSVEKRKRNRTLNGYHMHYS